MDVHPPPIPMTRLQRADKLLGAIACVLLQPLRWARALPRWRPSEPRVLLIKFWGIGSLQLLTPAVRALRRRHAGAELVLLTLSENRAFAEGLGVFDEVLALDVRTPRWTVVAGRILNCIRTLRTRRFAAVYDFEFFTRFSGVVTLLAGAPESRGFASPSVWRGRFHTGTVPFNRYWHVARNFRCLAGGEDGSEVRPADLVPFAAGTDDAAAAERALAALADGTGPLVVLNPNAGSLSLERRWPPSRFGALARRLVLEDGARVVLVGAPGERAWVEGVAAAATEPGPLPDGRLANLAGALSIGSLAALLGRASAFVTNDSGPMHVAAALGTPTVGLFGPETPVMYAPIGERARALYRPPACSPCINVHDNKVMSCHRGRPECLTNLEVDEVLAETRALVRRGELRPVAGAAS